MLGSQGSNTSWAASLPWGLSTFSFCLSVCLSLILSQSLSFSLSPSLSLSLTHTHTHTHTHTLLKTKTHKLDAGSLTARQCAHLSGTNRVLVSPPAPEELLFSGCR